MGCEWIRATSQDSGKTIYVNIAESAEEILGPAGEIEIVKKD